MKCLKCIHYEDCEREEHIDEHLMKSGCGDFKKEIDYTTWFFIILDSILAGFGVWLIIQFFKL